jgi:integrase
VSNRISVNVFRAAGRTFYQASWIDPISGREKRRSTGTEIKRDAERFAGALERQLLSGTYRDPSRVPWAEFRKRFESEVLPSKASKTGDKIRAMFNAVERHIDPNRLMAVDADQISRFQQKLRDDDKLAEPSIKGHLAYLQSALNWAKKLWMIVEVPAITMPTRTASMKGRAITAEELERMLAKVPDVVLAKRKDGAPPKSADQLAADAEAVESWRYTLRGLWWSGLRLGEALALDWTDDRQLCLDLSGRRPVFRIRAEAEKGYKERTLPMAPQFAEMLQAVPEALRTGRVFNPAMQREHGKARRVDTVSSIIVAIGKSAGVKVSERRGKVKYASAHDLRRCFGTRWARLVMPPVLQQLMRHEDIQTTMTYYADLDAEATADAVWDAFGRSAQRLPDTFTDSRPAHENASPGQTTQILDGEQV